jgi:hypothetical protein
MGPLLEPLGAASQGSKGCFSRNSTRGVERLLELQLYSPKEREGDTLVHFIEIDTNRHE